MRDEGRIYASLILPPSSFYQGTAITPPQMRVDDGGCKRVSVARRAPHPNIHTALALPLLLLGLHPPTASLQRSLSLLNPDLLK
jgi:hypothetical protein